jgi:SSS family solute:Na+ symporter
LRLWPLLRGKTKRAFFFFLAAPKRGKAYAANNSMPAHPWVLDLFIILAYFCAVLWLGLRFKGKEQDLETFALAGRQMPWWAVLASIIAAETSAGTFLGTPAEGFALQNYTYLQLALGTILGRLLVAGFLLRPYYAYGVYSIYEFLALRFGPKTQKAAAAIFLFTRTLACAARLYIAAVILAVGWKLFLGAAGSLHTQWLSYAAALLLLTLATTAYTAIGGIRAVIWTDLLQALLMLGSGVVAFCVLWQRIKQTLSGATPADLLPLRLCSFISLGLPAGHAPWNGWTALASIFSQDYTLWAALFGSTFLTMATHGTDQDMVQRMLTAPDLRRSRFSLVASGLADLPVVFLFLSVGILLFHYYRLHQDPALPAQPNEAFPYFVLREMPPGLRGMLLAGLFATAMGSLSAGLNSLAVSFTRDWWVSPSSAERGQANLARRFTVLFAFVVYLVSIGIAGFALKHPTSRMIPIALGIFGYTYGSLLGVFLLGVFTRRRGSDTGNLWAMFCGFLVVAWLSGLPGELLEGFLGPSPFLPSDPRISFPWRVFVGTWVTFFVGACFSSRSTEKEAKVEEPVEAQP